MSGIMFIGLLVLAYVLWDYNKLAKQEAARRPEPERHMSAFEHAEREHKKEIGK